MSYYIFGDSFAAKYGPRHYFNNETGELWQDILEETTKEKLEIFADGGWGPYTSFQDFYSQFEQGLVKDKLIFFLSCQYRLPIDLPVEQRGNHVNQPVVLQVLKGDKDTILKPLEYEIFFTHKIFKEEIYRANIKNIYFLKTLSQIKKIKTMVFLCFKFNRPKLHKFIKLKEIYELENLNDEYFNVYTKPLYHVSLEESVNKKDYDNGDNYRANHLSYCNHRIMVNRILNFFTGTDLDENWHKDFLTTWNDPSKGKDHFIYE